jgi:hypothetical protein
LPRKKQFVHLPYCCSSSQNQNLRGYRLDVPNPILIVFEVAQVKLISILRDDPPPAFKTCNWLSGSFDRGHGLCDFLHVDIDSQRVSNFPSMPILVLELANDLFWEAESFGIFVIVNHVFGQ